MTDMIGDRSVTILGRCVTFGAFGHGGAGRCCIILGGDFGSVMIGHGRDRLMDRQGVNDS